MRFGVMRFVLLFTGVADCVGGRVWDFSSVIAIIALLCISYDLVFIRLDLSVCRLPSLLLLFYLPLYRPRF